MAIRTAESFKTKRTLKTTKGLVKKKKNIIIMSIVAVASIGAALFFFANAATNNCQKENKVDICDVDQTAGGSDTVLSTNGEAESLGGQGWGIYYGAAFRAPTSAYNGAVPVHRIFNANATWHEYATDSQKSQKEAKYGAQTNEGVSFFAWTSPGQPGTVPIYRITRGGASTQAMFSADKAWIDKMIAIDASNPDGWKMDNLMPGIAFYAFPPNYKVAGVANPYDCAVYENFVSPRCAQAAKAVVTAVDNGSIPKSTACPSDLTTYLKNPLSSAYPADCQKFWNVRMNDCSLAENFVSERCKTQRETLAASQKVQIQNRAAAVPTARKSTTPTKTSTTKKTTTTTTNTTTPTTASGPTSGQCQGLTGAALIGCKKDINLNTPPPVRKSCTIKYNSPNYWWRSSSSEGSDPYSNSTSDECYAHFKYQVDKGWRWNIREYWGGNLINSTPNVRPK